MSIPLFFFFNDTATTEIYTLSLHDALPISTLFGVNTKFTSLSVTEPWYSGSRGVPATVKSAWRTPVRLSTSRSEEHTSELQSHSDLVCRLLLEKKKRRAQTR